MIAYSSVTVREAIDEVSAKISKFETAANLDDKAIFRFLESARREVFATMLPFKDKAFIREVAVADGDPVPQEFDRELVLRVKAPADTEYKEARRISIKEMWTLTNTTRPHSHDAATVAYPCYTMYGNGNPADDRLCVHLFPNTVSGFMEYYAAPQNLPRDVNNDFIGGSLLTVPYEYESYLINSTLLRCYVRIGEVAEVKSMVETMARQRFKLLSTNRAMKVTTGINMESLPNPEPAATPNVLPTPNQ